MWKTEIENICLAPISVVLGTYLRSCNDQTFRTQNKKTRRGGTLYECEYCLEAMTNTCMYVVTQIQENESIDGWVWYSCTAVPVGTHTHAISLQRSAGKLAGTKNVFLVEAECPHVP